MKHLNLCAYSFSVNQTSLRLWNYLLNESNHMGIRCSSRIERSSTSLCDWDAFCFHYDSCNNVFKYQHRIPNEMCSPSSSLTWFMPPCSLRCQCSMCWKLMHKIEKTNKHIASQRGGEAKTERFGNLRAAAIWAARIKFANCRRPHYR